MDNTREKLLKLLDNSFKAQQEKYTFLTAQYTVEDLIDNGVTFAEDINVPAKWISVEDRLPEVGQEVLAIKNDRGYCVVMYSDTYKGFFGGQFPVNGVTHWMPLQEPPKGE